MAPVGAVAHTQGPRRLGPHRLRPHRLRPHRLRPRAPAASPAGASLWALPTKF